MDSQRNRFFWAMRYIASNGFYVVIDDHLAYDTLVLDDTAKWVASWQQLAADIAKDPVLRLRVMLDLLNEPDARGIKWSNGPKGPTAGMATYYEQAMDAIYKVGCLFFSFDRIFREWRGKRRGEEDERGRGGRRRKKNI